MGEFILPDFQTDCEATLSKMVWHWCNRYTKQWNKIENPEIPTQP